LTARSVKRRTAHPELRARLFWAKKNQPNVNGSVQAGNGEPVQGHGKHLALFAFLIFPQMIISIFQSTCHFPKNMIQ
jgi:hypothetical protein